jgi:hypothetical protein
VAVGGTLDDGSQLSDEEVGGVAQMAVTEEHSTISCCSLTPAGQRYGMRCDLGVGRGAARVVRGAERRRSSVGAREGRNPGGLEVGRGLVGIVRPSEERRKK